MTAFGKAVFTNVLNHQQKTSWDVSKADAVSGLSDPWVAANPVTSGQPTSIANYETGRTLIVSTGFRF